VRVSATDIRVGVVGTGFGKRVHIPAYQAAGGWQVTAVCSADPARAKEAAEEAGAEHAYDDFEAMAAADDVDVISVATPPKLHAAVTEAALRHGKHVITEKPFAMDTAQARQLVGLAEEAGVVAAVVHEMRYLPLRRHLSDVIASGYLGEVRTVVATVIADYAVNPSMEPYYYGWVNLRSEAGGYLNSLLSHHIDLTRFTFGELYDVTGRVAITHRQRPVLPWEYRDGDPIGPETVTVGVRAVDADDTAYLTARLGNGALVVLGGSWAVNGGTGARVEAYGSDASLVLDSTGLRGLRAGRSEWEPLVLPEHLQVAVPEGHYMVPFFAGMARDVRAAILGEGGESTYPTFRDGLRVQEITDQLLGS
jgi:predicted dehydrogenase